eukprot:933872_1
MPGSPSVPNIVYVLPDEVCPYAKIQPLMPLQLDCTIRFVIVLYNANVLPSDLFAIPGQMYSKLYDEMWCYGHSKLVSFHLGFLRSLTDVNGPRLKSYFLKNYYCF